MFPRRLFPGRKKDMPGRGLVWSRAPDMKKAPPERGLQDDVPD